MNSNWPASLTAIVCLVLQVYPHEKDRHVLPNAPSPFGSRHSSTSNGNYRGNLCFCRECKLGRFCASFPLKRPGLVYVSGFHHVSEPQNQRNATSYQQHKDRPGYLPSFSLVFSLFLDFKSNCYFYIAVAHCVSSEAFVYL